MVIGSVHLNKAALSSSSIRELKKEKVFLFVACLCALLFSALLSRSVMLDSLQPRGL